MKMVLRMFVIVALVFRVDSTAEAKVERLEILERTPFAEGHQFGNSGAYERIRGRLHYAVDPYNAANGLIVDLALAPLDSQGMVPFSGDFMLLRPVEPKRGNQTLLYEVGNRGNVGMLSFFNDAPRTNQPISLADTGNGFLFREGYTLLWSAWNWDVIDGNHRMQIDLPVATDGGDPIINRIAVEITVNVPSRCEPFAWGNSRGYPPVPKFAESGTLSVRARQTDSRHLLPRNRWSFGCVPRGGEAPSSTHLYLVDGFEPGLLYELIYKTRDPRIVGLGLAAIRDTMSFFRFFETDSVGIPNPLWGATDNALVFGISQSGRVIQHMIYQALHIDEANGWSLRGRWSTSPVVARVVSIIALLKLPVIQVLMKTISILQIFFLLPLLCRLILLQWRWETYWRGLKRIMLCQRFFIQTRQPNIGLGPLHCCIRIPRGQWMSS